ncbi:MAG TPA: FAD-dependent oxidoreductase, partial [Candidatus Acidoferrales bacterium]|nr:FAD-dependent oxidoreductase [Candidatus Acidoferrales bacterium]
MNAPATIVVGGGIAGLYSALRLTKRGDRVTIVDAEASVGGLTRPWEIGGITWDRFYHVILESDRRTRGLLAEIGLTANLEFKPVKTAFFTGGKLHPFSSVRDFLVFPELGMFDKTRLIATILHARQFGANDASDRESVVRYLRAWSGENAFERVWKPLLRAKLGERYPEASAAFIQATIKRLQGTRRHGFREERYGYVSGGYATILAALEAKLRHLGVTFILGSRVRAVISHGDRVSVATENATLSGDRA